MEYNLKHYAHIGDAVWELFIRKEVIHHALNQKKMHNLTTKFVCAQFQAQMLENLEDFLTFEEKDLARRARNLPITISKKSNPQTHRNATALEVLTGYFYLNDKKRLDEFFEIIKKSLKFEQ